MSVRNHPSDVWSRRWMIIDWATDREFIVHAENATIALRRARPYLGPGRVVIRENGTHDAKRNSIDDAVSGPILVAMVPPKSQKQNGRHR